MKFLGRLFAKMMCQHTWKSHNKQERYLESMNGVTLKEYTREVLICEKCGKIKTIEY